MEIKPQELRIGNFIDRNGLMEVKGINLTTVRVYDHYNKCSISHGFPVYSFKGIELTPEWLERFGFEYAEGFADDYTKQPITVYNNPFKVGWTVENLFNQQIKEDILVLRYVHQLQNLFYALTGEELAIDKTSLI